MEIVWLGRSCFRLRSKEATVITDPYQPSAGPALGRLTADIVTVSHGHPGHNNAAAVTGSPHLVDGPGEYEIKGVFVTGIRTFHDAEQGKRSGKNMSYLIELDDVVICHLGDLGHVLTTHQVEEMSRVHVLLVPIGEEQMLGPAEAAEVISLIEPRIVVPMHYQTGADAPAAAREVLERFCRELGAAVQEPQPKLTVNASSLPEDTQVVVLEPRKT